MLQVEGVSAGYGGLEVLHDLSLRVEHTEIVSLLGANGAGKTTFLRALSGLIPLGRGRIVFADRDISRLAAHRRVALVLGPVFNR